MIQGDMKRVVEVQNAALANPDHAAFLNWLEESAKGAG